MSEVLHINLVKEIRKYPVLFAQANLSCEKENRAKIWKAISDKLNIDAKAKWNYVRDQYTKKKKANCTSWYLYDLLDFLDERKARKHKAEQNSTEALKNDCSTDTDSESVKNLAMKDLEEIYGSVEEYLPTSMDQESESSLTLTPAKKKRKFEDDNDISITLLDTLKPVNDKPAKKKQKFEDDKDISVTLLNTLNQVNDKLNNYFTDDDNEDWHFLQSIRYKMRKMSHKQKTKYKVIMLQAADYKK